MVTPAQGDLIWVDLDPTLGHEQSGHRPALVLSQARYNEVTGLCLAMPVTSRSKGYPFEARLPEGLPVSGVVLADQIKCLDWRTRNIRIIGRAPEAVLAEAKAKLAAIID